MTKSIETPQRWFSWISVALFVLPVAVGCAQPADEPGGRAGDGEKSSARLKAPLPECGADGYPCIWAEVSEEALERTERTGLVAASLMQNVQDLETVAKFLLENVELAELGVGDTALRFRLPGSRGVWIPLPFDPENPRRGGGSSPPRLPALTASIFSSPLSAQPAGDADKIAAERIGKGKKALILAPFWYHIGKETTDVYQLFAASPNYSTTKGGKVEVRANLKRQEENAAHTPRDDGTQFVSGQVTIADFLNWNEYNFVYLASHGYADCPTDSFDSQDRANYRKRVAELQPQIDAEKCHTAISVREFPRVGWLRARAARDRFADREWKMDGVEVAYKKVAVPHIGLTRNQASWCLSQQDPQASPPGTTKPCFQIEDIPTEVVVTSKFFSDHYEGFNDKVIFLAVCEAMWANDLVKALAPAGNRDVAVFGFNRAVRDNEARRLGTLAVKKFLDPGYDNEKIKELLEAEADEAGITHFDGVVRGRGVAPPIAQIAESSSNPTHARDVVELLDPQTTEELEDGATVRVRGCPGDGRDDYLEVHPVIVGVDDPADLDATTLRVAVGGREPQNTYQPRDLLEEGKYVWREGIAMGRDSRRGVEVVNLEVRGELPEEGRSRWEYEDINLQAAKCCSFTARLSGDVSRNLIEGEFAMWSQPTQDAAALAGPLLRSLAGTGFGGPAGDADPEAMDRAISQMEGVDQIQIKMVEGEEDVNSFNLTVFEASDGNIGVMALVDGMEFLAPGVLDIQSSSDGWISGTLVAETGSDTGVATKRGFGPPPRGYDLKMEVEFVAGNPMRGAFCTRIEDD